MGIFDGCLITSDIDDTLVNDGYINPKNIEKIEFFISQGGRFSVATGRSAAAIGHVTSAIKNLSPSVVSNGCVIYDYENQKVLYGEVIPKEDHKLIKEIIDRGLNTALEVHCEYEVYSLVTNAVSKLHEKYEWYKSIVSTFEDVDCLNWNKCVCLSEDASVYEEIRKIASELGVKSFGMPTRAVWDGKLYNFLEIIPQGVSKASAIDKLCEIFNIKPCNSYAIGDYYNDIAMLKNAAISAATAGAPAEVKEIANYVTVSCIDGAVADFIDYLTDLHKKG